MSLLDKIQNPVDIKSLSTEDLAQLASEIRQELIKTIAHLGGHLASSLGAVELCLALHYVFDAPHDQLVWDMGYQAFTHKLITGRRGQFGTLKQFKGLAGFNNKDESEYDLFSTGHGGTALSTALGLAMARDRAGISRHVAAIIGDASLGEGMALEALNHIGHLKPNMMVILNDNKMSISKPIGGISRYLNRIITNPTYNRLRADVDTIMEKLPSGSKLVRVGHRVEDQLKGLLVPGRVFQDLGFRYVGPIQGHNLPELIRTLRNVKRLKGPTLLHIVTTKGKGYKPAEQDPERFHKTEAFDIETGKEKAKPKPRGRSAQSFTDAFTDELLKIAESDARVHAITAAMPEGTGLGEFGRRFPDRFIDVGMAEQHAVGLAAGLATGGMRPLVGIYSTFMQRAFDQIMHEACLQKLPMVLALDRAGLVGEDGSTHHGVFDVAYLRVLPNIIVISPKDPDELRAMLRWAFDQPLPVALRYSRGGIVCGEPLGKPARIVSGQAEVLREGTQVALVALGSMVYPALKVAEDLAKEGISAMVVNARFVKPFDDALLKTIGTQIGRVVTLEESQIAAGFGSAVSESLDRSGCSSVALLRIGLTDAFVEHGSRQQLLDLCKLDPASVTKTVLNWYHRSPAGSASNEARVLTELVS